MKNQNMEEKINNTKEMKLSQYKDIWTKFCFLDETGSLSINSEQFFTIGLLKMSQPYYLQNKLIFERSKIGFYDELKFNKLSKNNIGFAKIVIDSIFDTKSISFLSYTINTKSKYFVDNFNFNQWKSYQDITLKLLSASLSENEILILIADHITTPKEIKFEVDVKRHFNSSKDYLALAGVCRLDSKANDLLQVVDLIIGSITYNLKYEKKMVEGSKYKLELTKYFMEKLGCGTFKQGFRNHNFNIFVDYSEIIKPNEKGLSS